MNITPKNSCSPRHSLGFRVLPFQPIQAPSSRAAADDGDSIVLAYSHGKPSTSADVMPAISQAFDLPIDGSVYSVSAVGQVDDSVSISIAGKSDASTGGAAHPFNLKIEGLLGGYHRLSVVHTNINEYPDPYGNVSMIAGSVGVSSSIEIVPDENVAAKCDCDCDDDADEGGSSHASSSGSRALRVTNLGSSSAGSRMIREAELEYMRWAASFGVFRGLGGIPKGRLELMAYEYNAFLLKPVALVYRHPFASAVLVPEGGIVPNELFRVYDGGAYTNYICDANGTEAFGVGSTSSVSDRAEFVSSLSRDSSVVRPLEQSIYLRLAKTNGTACFYSLTTGEFAGYISSQNALLTAQDAENYLSILREEEGSIRQIWNLWDGLADIVSSETGYHIDLYLPSQVRGKDATSGLYRFEGDPFKTFSVGGDSRLKTLRVTERDLSLPESMPPYEAVWTHTAGGWGIAVGASTDTITTSREKTTLSEEGKYRVVTTISKGGIAASVVSEEYLSHSTGELILSRTEGYNSSEAQTSTNEYDRAGRVIRSLSHDGGETRYVYDAKGRVIVTTTPWAGGKSRLLQTTYLDDGSENADEPAQVDSNVLTPEGIPHLHLRELYSYSTSNQVKRVEKRSTANGITRLEIRETWQGDAPNTYARGRVKMIQATNGIQSCYDYVPTNQYSALYTESIETRINGATVAGQSTRSIRYISEQGNTNREEEWILDSHNTWQMLSSFDNEFDMQNRLIKQTRSNGRITTRTLMCTGNVLREIDEDGVLTSYSYDTARQLIETIRSATPTRPETITSYARDAMDRILEERIDIGSMTTIKRTSYDLLGRTIESRDELNRLSLYTYSEDGLSTTITTPSGATLISTRNTDGSIAHESGTGQRELYHAYDYAGGRIRETVKLADQNTILSQTLENGFGENIVLTSPTTLGYLYDRAIYNEKGQLTQTSKDTGSGAGSISMSPRLYEYDSFSNLTKETWKHNATPTTANSRITSYTYAVESRRDGIYRISTATKHDAAGNTYRESSAELISESNTLENKREATDARGNVSTSWTEYGEGTARTQKSSIPSSNITASRTVIDGFITTQSDHAGVTSQQTISYISSGMRLSQTDGRGNTSIILGDITGRTLTVTDAAGNTESRTYCNCCDNPASITDALGNTTHYKYDQRNRKTAEWGSNIQPACFAYDDANRIVSLKTFRVNESDINSDPTERSDGDTTTWEYHDATGLELTKTYADGSKIRKEYNALGLLGHLHNARGNNATYAYNTNTGTIKSIQHTDGTAPQSFSYNQLAQITQITDASGIRTITYNEYNEAISENLNGDEINHLISETQDSYGRNTGYSYSKAGILQQSVNIGYGEEGRIATTSFLHEGIEQQFSYSYLEGSHLLHTLAHPNNILLSNTYEEQRNLITSMNVTRGTTDVILRSYSYDALARPLSRDCGRRATSRNDSFTYNTRSELIQAELGSKHYAYSYDNIGNRKTAQELAEESTYEANQLNQYSTITQSQTSFTPTFDADGNQTLIKTTTGIWSAVYSADNRPISFTQAQGDQNTIIECGYDYIGRRYTKKVTSNGVLSLHQRYIYRGYLQIACVDLTRSEHPALWYITWDPTEPVATRPLAIQKNATWYSYSHDLTKNVTELYQSDGLIASTYDYSPYGAATAEGIDQPLQYSSEYHDPELALTYYNYRHYNPTDGRWINRDPIQEGGGFNLYGFVGNNSIFNVDFFGLVFKIETDAIHCVIKVILDIIFYPLDKEAKKELKDSAKKSKTNIEANWNGFTKGCCSIKVTANIIVKDEKPNMIYRWWYPSKNYIGITFTPNTLFKNTNRSYVQNHKTGKWWGPNLATNTSAHEAGHLLGLLDKYKENKKTGKITIPPEYQGHMMADKGPVQTDEIGTVVKNIQCPCDKKKS